MAKHAWILFLPWLLSESRIDLGAVHTQLVLLFKAVSMAANNA